jgi:hypothetical protein
MVVSVTDFGFVGPHYGQVIHDGWTKCSLSKKQTFFARKVNEAMFITITIRDSPWMAIGRSSDSDSRRIGPGRLRPVTRLQRDSGRQPMGGGFPPTEHVVPGDHEAIRPRRSSGTSRAGPSVRPLTSDGQQLIQYSRAYSVAAG